MNFSVRYQDGSLFLKLQYLKISRLKKRENVIVSSAPSKYSKNHQNQDN